MNKLGIARARLPQTAFRTPTIAILSCLVTSVHQEGLDIVTKKGSPSASPDGIQPLKGVSDQRVRLRANEAAAAARVFMEQGDNHNARGSLLEAVSLFAQVRDRREVMACQGGLAALTAGDRDFPEAIELYKGVCDLARELGETAFEAVNLLNLAKLYNLTGKAGMADACKKRAEDISLESARADVIRLSTMVAENEVGCARPTVPQQASTKSEEAMANVADILLDQEGNPEGKVFAYWSKGEIFKTQGQFAAASEAFSHAITEAVDNCSGGIGLPYADVVSACFLGLAESRIQMNRMNEALEDLAQFFQRAQRPDPPENADRDNVDCHGAAMLYACGCNLEGEALLRLGRTQEAQISMEQSVQIFFEWQGRAIFTKRGLFEFSNAAGRCFFSLGKLLVDTNRPDEALDKLKFALSCFELTENELGQAGVLLDRANALAEVDKRRSKDRQSYDAIASPNAEVMEAFEAARNLYAKLGDRHGMAAVRGTTASFLLENGWPAQALPHYEEAVLLHGELEQADALVQDYLNQARAYRRMGLSESALGSLMKAYELSASLALINLEWQAAALLGELELSLGRSGARGHLEAALSIIESQRSLLLTEDHRINFFKDKTRVYELLVDALLKEGENDLAFTVVERSRSRALLDLMKDAVLPTPSAIPAEWLIEENVLLTEIRAMEAALTNASMEPSVPGAESTGKSVDRRDLKTRTMTARNSLLDIQARIEALAPEYSSLRRGDPVSIEVARHLATASRPILIVEFFVAGNEVRIFGVASGSSQTLTATLPLDLTDLRRMVRSNSGTLGDSKETTSADFENLLQSYDYLLKFVLEWSEEGDLIYFIPHGLLHHLPLHALRTGGRHLIERNPVVYAPSTSVLKFCQAKRKPRLHRTAISRALVLGDPRNDLPKARQEAKEIARLFGVSPRLGGEVTLKAVRNMLREAEIVHFAGHGYFDDKDPLASGLEFAGEEILTARDVLALGPHCAASFVALGGCETGVSEQTSGDELLGLMRAFLFTGASSLLLSLWTVDDDSTAFFMIEFYRALLKADTCSTAVDALQQAVLATRAIYPALDQWAPFILVGDWA